MDVSSISNGEKLIVLNDKNKITSDITILVVMTQNEFVLNLIPRTKYDL